MKMVLLRQRGCLSVTWIVVTIFCLQCHASIYVYELEGHSLESFTHIVFSYKFGAQWPKEGHVGMTVLADPEDGCTSVKPPPNATNINEFGSWIVLMKIGGCDVTVKARNAQNATYDLAIIYRNENFIFYDDHMVFDNTTNNSDIKINAVLTVFAYGDEIKRDYLYDKKVFFQVTPGNDYCFRGMLYKKGKVPNAADCSEWMKT